MYMGDDITVDIPSKLSNMLFYDSTVDNDEDYIYYNYYDGCDDTETDSFTMAKSFHHSTKDFLLNRTKIPKKYILSKLGRNNTNMNGVSKYSSYNSGYKPKLSKMYFDDSDRNFLSSYFKMISKRYNRRGVMNVSIKRRIYRYLNYLRCM